MTTQKPQSQLWTVAGVLLAIGITSTMDATGLSMISALPLLPLWLLFWWRQRLGRREIGLVWGRPWHYGLAVLYPVVVLGTTVFIALVARATDLSDPDWQTVGTNFLVMSLAGIVMGLLTEEGFFRGWLWGSLTRAGKAPAVTLVWCSIAFSAWHWTWAIIEDGLDLSPAQAPVYLLNAALMGAGWGLLRWISGSIVVASVSHALWNAIAYPLFGSGPIKGALGITNKFLFGAEVGVVGLILNLLFVLALWRWWSARSASD